MICISKQWLDLVAPGLGVTSRPGLFVSSIFSFGGGGSGGKDTAGLEDEDEPRTLVLIGMADRYGVGGRCAASIITMCVDVSELGARLPSPAERRTIIGLLQDQPGSPCQVTIVLMQGSARRCST